MSLPVRTSDAPLPQSYEAAKVAENFSLPRLPTTPIVYVIQAEIGGPVKIGRTTFDRLGDRLAEIQTGNPERLRIVTTVEGGAETEAFIHACLKDYRINGEWFDPICLSAVGWGRDARIEIYRLVAAQYETAAICLEWLHREDAA